MLLPALSLSRRCFSHRTGDDPKIDGSTMNGLLIVARDHLKVGRPFVSKEFPKTHAILSLSKRQQCHSQHSGSGVVDSGLMLGVEGSHLGSTSAYL